MFDTASMSDFWLRVLGLYFLIAGIGVFAQADRMAGMVAEMRESFLLRFIGGILAFASGVLILATLGPAPGGEAMLVRVIGWVALIKGVFLIIAPPALMGVYEAFIARPGMMRVWAVLIGLLGVGGLWLGLTG
ncbi:hypothetical protein [uncultured Maricaulis sp.]|uniref:hypothetical protein n=1 Tax=uncultured Maricaulis sp. TaxID=174710 RepID=UPI0026263003|nr:hypothetical protein [uncultured Maricaulis sp.]